jgi:hypothetical protein
MNVIGKIGILNQQEISLLLPGCDSLQPFSAITKPIVYVGFPGQ